MNAFKLPLSQVYGFRSLSPGSKPWKVVPRQNVCGLSRRQGSMDGQGNTITGGCSGILCRRNWPGVADTCGLVSAFGCPDRTHNFPRSRRSPSWSDKERQHPAARGGSNCAEHSYRQEVCDHYRHHRCVAVGAAAEWAVRDSNTIRRVRASISGSPAQCGES